MLSGVNDEQAVSMEPVQNEVEVSTPAVELTAGTEPPAPETGEVALGLEVTDELVEAWRECLKAKGIVRTDINEGRELGAGRRLKVGDNLPRILSAVQSNTQVMTTVNPEVEPVDTSEINLGTVIEETPFTVTGLTDAMPIDEQVSPDSYEVPTPVTSSSPSIDTYWDNGHRLPVQDENAEPSNVVSLAELRKKLAEQESAIRAQEEMAAALEIKRQQLKEQEKRELETTKALLAEKTASLNDIVAKIAKASNEVDKLEKQLGYNPNDTYMDEGRGYGRAA